MSLLIILIIILNIIYLSLKFVINLGQSNLNCSRLTLCFLFVLSISIWFTEVFFYCRGLKIIQQSSNVLGITEKNVQNYIIFCKIGIIFCFICLVLQLLLIYKYVQYIPFRFD